MSQSSWWRRCFPGLLGGDPFGPLTRSPRAASRGTNLLAVHAHRRPSGGPDGSGDRQEEFRRGDLLELFTHWEVGRSQAQIASSKMLLTNRSETST